MARVYMVVCSTCRGFDLECNPGGTNMNAWFRCEACKKNLDSCSGDIAYTQIDTGLMATMVDK